MRKLAIWLLACAMWAAASFGASAEVIDDDALVITAPEFDRPGAARTASGEHCGRLKITVRDRASGQLTPCRVNVVGPDGDFYQPAANRLSPYSLAGQWPETGKGNRPGKGPFRYLGRFFYTTGTTEVVVPAGAVRVEVFKGFEYHPVSRSVTVRAGESLPVSLELERVTPMAELGYFGGDPHLHFPRKALADDDVILDLLDAEDIRFGSILAYNEPAGPYTGLMETMAAPQLMGLGKSSVKHRGSIWIASGQEYRSGTYGHLNLYWRDELVLKGQKANADNWPLYGELSRETMRTGGFAVYAHGGYSQAIHADFVQEHCSAVELLQFGVYRGIGLAGWYDILNIGYRFPCWGASDYPACRKLGDCQTYVALKEKSDFAGWLTAAAEGRSFVTTGPLLLLEVDGERPGGIIRVGGTGPRRVQVKIRVISQVAPVQTVQLIAGGKVAFSLEVPREDQQGRWIEISKAIDLEGSSWIAARAFGVTKSGAPDAEAHTNPVYVDIGEKAPYNRDSLDRLLAALDQQMAAHRKRTFAEKARVLDYFQKSRDILLRIRQAGGLPAGGIPDSWIRDDPATAGVDASRRTHAEDELARFLEPVEASTPAQALKTFEAAPGFQMQIVAAEPAVASPVAAAFDADGNLYVAEMRDYPYKPKPGGRPLGLLRLLRDRDGDGQYDESHVFADGLLWAAGIAPWKGGVFVTAPPDLWYLKDTNGDGKADIRERVYTGFGTQNQQAMVNNLTWGLDHMIYGATAGNGGLILNFRESHSGPVSVEHNDFRFDPIRGSFEAISGSDQFGNTFDDWGNRFICDESHPLSQPVLPRRAVARNPALAISSVTQDIAGGSVPIFRISPVERWRQIRSSRRIAHGTRSAESAGASHHVVDAAAGVTVYRGSAYPAEFYGNIFVGDAQNNLIHRRILIPDGATFQAVRGPREQATEFVRSSDNWFRPVNFVNAPDGTLYVLDMSREVIEAIHIPLDVVKHLNLKRGRNQGRIYRIAPPGFKYTAPPRLSDAPIVDLVAALYRPDAWYRDTAHRLIYERQDKAATLPLRAMLGPQGARLPQSRVNALWSLEGLKALDDHDLMTALADSDAHVRAAAVQLAGKRLDASPELFHRVAVLADDPDAAVCFQTALALGESHDPLVALALSRIARRHIADRWISSAVLCSCGDFSAVMLVDLLDSIVKNELKSADRAAAVLFLGQLADLVAAANRRDEIDYVFDQLATKTNDGASLGVRDGVIMSLSRGLWRSGGRLVVNGAADGPVVRLAAGMIEETRKAVVDQKGTVDGRAAAIARLAALDPASLRAVLVAVLEPREPAAVRVAAVKALAESESPDVPGILLSRMRGFEPSVRAVAIRTMLARPRWTRELFYAIERNDPSSGLSALLIEPEDRPPLLKHGDADIATMAQKLFAAGSTVSRSQVIAEYAGAIGQKGDPALGAKVFERECKTCHKIGETGFALGPDLTGSPSGDPRALLANILDPNASVSPKDVQYLVIDQNGRSFSGLIGAETATSVTLRRGEGAEDTILRSRIDVMASTGLSLMPDGFEKKISRNEMADLIAFLRGVHRGGDGKNDGDQRDTRPLDIGTLPGLIEPDD